MWIVLTLLGAFLWAVINVGNSVLVAQYHKSPFFLLWVQTAFSMVFLACIALTTDVWTPWMPWIVGCSLVAYGGDLLFFWILDRLDVSVTNAAWAILAIFMSIVGFTFFHETWTLQQFFGASLVILGVFILSFFYHHESLLKTVGLLALLAILYVPAYGLRKAALLAGEPVLPIVFWLIFGRDILAFIAPLVIKKQRMMLIRTLPRSPVSFYGLSALVISCFYAAEFTLSHAYATGPVSLISVIGNAQPFFVMMIAAPIVRYVPSMAPKELMTKRSTKIKTASFLVVFIGLALLTASQ